jgi:hypothetical protein
MGMEMAQGGNAAVMGFKSVQKSFSWSRIMGVAPPGPAMVGQPVGVENAALGAGAADDVDILGIAADLDGVPVGREDSGAL